MKRRTLPSPFKSYRRIGGVLKFVVFDEAEGDEASLLEAISAAVPNIDIEVLKSLGRRRIDKRTFYGDWYNADADALLRLGSHTTGDGRELVDPKLTDLERARVIYSAAPCPDAGAGGQFAFAFFNTPYGLRAPPWRIEELFHTIRDVILPPGQEQVILDWSHPRLPEASPYFAAGMEFWGVFLFTIHVPAWEQLTVIAGSTSD